ncbi:hypothetical protein DFH29DRAFT_366068 [Suillus ampliporus]|nr:hypothetical protein DFH29DRAFT_366068 [Suillus ampliporus]
MVNLCSGIMIGLAAGANSGLNGEDDIYSGTYNCWLNQNSLMAYYAILPTFVWEIFAFGLAARCFVVHMLEMRRLRPQWKHDCLTILFRDHTLWFLFYIVSNCLPTLDILPLHETGSSSAWLIYNGVSQLLLNIQQFVVMPRLVLSIREFYEKDVEASKRTMELELETVVFAPVETT